MEDQTGTATATAEPVATPAPAASPSPAPGAAPAPTESFINTDGTLKAGWQDSDLIPQDFKGRKVYNALGTAPTYADLMKHIGNQDIAISRQGKGIMVPPPDATQTEKDMFFKAIGRPDTPAGYDEAIKSVIPKGMEDHFADKEAMGELTTAMHKAGATPQVVATAVGIYAQQVARAQESLKADPMPFFEEVLPLVQPLYKAAMEAELQKRWGDMYQSRMNLFQRAVAENTKEGPERDLLLVNCERDPVFMDLLATMMNKSFTSGMGPDTSTGSPAGAQNTDQRIDELMRDPNYMDGRTNPSRHKYLVNEVQRLMASKKSS